MGIKRHILNKMSLLTIIKRWKKQYHESWRPLLNKYNNVCGCQTFGPFGLKIPMQFTRSRVGWRFSQDLVGENIFIKIFDTINKVFQNIRAYKSKTRERAKEILR